MVVNQTMKLYSNISVLYRRKVNVAHGMQQQDRLGGYDIYTIVLRSLWI